MGRRRRGVLRRIKKKGGEGGYIRIQNKSSVEVEIKIVDGRKNIDDVGMDKIVGIIKPGESLPKEGQNPFDDDSDDDDDDGPPAVYQYIEGDVRNRFQKDGFFHLEAHPTKDGKPSSSLTLVVDHNSWESKDTTPDIDSSVKLVADVDEEDKDNGNGNNDNWKIELRVYDNYNPKKWMEEYGTKHQLGKKRLCDVGIPGTHDSGTYKFNKKYGASPESGLTKVEDILDHGKLLGKVTDFVLQNIFERLCQCQDLSIKEQLHQGIRYFDLRVAYHSKSQNYMTCHGVYCVNIKEILQEIKDFITENTKEIIILEFKKLFEMEELQYNELANIVIDILGVDKVADRTKVKQTSTIQEYWNNNYQIVCLYQKRDPLTANIQSKFWSLSYINSPWPNAGDNVELYSKLHEYVHDHDNDTFFVLQGLLTPDVELIKNEILESGGLSIKQISNKCKGCIVDWVEEEWKPTNRLNIVIVDFFQNCSIIPSIINYNRT